MKELEFTIRPLAPELCEDWLLFFDKIAFEDHGEWAFCYCLEGYLDPETQEKWTDPKERREKAVEFIQTGKMQGYLAYSGNTIVGWCNANDREQYKYVTEMFRKVGYKNNETNEKVKSIFCFLIAPKYRGQGVAQKLLHQVCEDAVRDEYNYVEAYPFGDKEFPYQYHGTAKMYKQNGFLEVADLKYVKVMQKKLSQESIPACQTVSGLTD